MTRADYDKLTTGLHILALDIGLNAAARAMGIKETRARKIASRGKWNMTSKSPIVSGYASSTSPKVTPIEIKQKLLEHYSDRTKLAASAASTKVFEHLADQPASTLTAPANAIAADQWSKVADRTLGWTQSRAQGQNVTVNVANILPPTPEQDAERKARHAKLDELTKLLHQNAHS